MPQDPTAHQRAPHARPRRFSLLISGATALGTLGLLGLIEGCHIEANRPVVHFELSEATRAMEGAEGEQQLPRIPLVVQDQIRGSLEMLFGTPSNPGYMMTGDWESDGYDPNWPTYEVGDRGSGEFTEDDLDDFARGNARRMARQLAAIEEQRYEDVTVPDSAPDLESKWDELMAGTPPESRSQEFQDEARDLLTNWYPTLADSAEMYRLQCLHCHGTEGGGDGPTADFLDPRPRDYRKGIFKFTPLRNKAVPRRQDLYKILDQGVTGTAMPSFRRFSRAELEGLVDYVRLLSMRGMVENSLATTYEFEGYLGAEHVLEAYSDVFERWQRSEAEGESLVIAWDGEVPDPSPESIALGRELFMDVTKGNCLSCHGESGRGDGFAAYKMDPETGDFLREDDTGKKVEAYNDDWGQPIQPRNLSQGILAGGRRPIDIFRRIKAGINGTPMPALEGVVDDEGIWAIVHFVGTLTEGGLFYPELSAHAEPAEEGHH